MNTNAPGSKRTLLALALLGVAMFGLSFAMVPLYNLFCQVTGIQSVSVRTSTPDRQQISTGVDSARSVTLKFDTSIHPELPWKFTPQLTEMKVIPGQLYKVDFSAHNTSHEPVTAQAIPSVAPWQASGYLAKLECFCFGKQTLAGGQMINMPLQFRLSPDLPADIRSMTLSYSLLRYKSDSDGENSMGSKTAGLASTGVVR